ncbi:hypothetical protein GCM10010505_52910 [Kitasatospora aburaviensis]
MTIVQPAPFPGRAGSGDPPRRPAVTCRYGTAARYCGGPFPSPGGGIRTAEREDGRSDGTARPAAPAAAVAPHPLPLEAV